MTQVVSVKSPKGDVTLIAGQVWQNDSGQTLTIVAFEMSPNMDALGNNVQVIATSASGELLKGTLHDFVSRKLTLVNYVDFDTVAGLHSHHLLDLYNTIAVGQRWQHYKGDIYTITSVALDANEGSDNFNVARISYRPLQSGKTPEWSLTVEEFLRLADNGQKRFTPVKMSGKDKRNVQTDKSLRYLWRIYE